jgi:hypothetical protein|tara:strand:- start:61 stop:435 length:375 start_codon:yes stop_codon:yes gene_type:complete
MPKIKLIYLAENYEVPFDEAIKIVKEKIPEEFITGKGRNTWISEEGQSIIEDGLFIDEIIPKNYIGKVISVCPNTRYNFVHSKEIGKKIPVMIPRRLRGSLVGKMINFEGIEDDRGISYRYVKK